VGELRVSLGLLITRFLSTTRSFRSNILLVYLTPIFSEIQLLPENPGLVSVKWISYANVKPTVRLHSWHSLNTCSSLIMARIETAQFCWATASWQND